MDKETVVINGVACLLLDAAARFLGYRKSSLYRLTGDGTLPTVRVPWTRTEKAIPLDVLETFKSGGRIIRQKKIMVPLDQISSLPSTLKLPGMPAEHISYNAYMELQATIRSLGNNALDGYRALEQKYGELIEEATDISQTAKYNGKSFVGELSTRIGASPKEQDALNTLWDEQARKIPVESHEPNHLLDTAMDG